MKIVKTVVLAVLFVFCVLLASANVQTVELVFLPDLPISGWPSLRSVNLPLFILVLAALVGGVLFGGLGALLEQVRLRSGLRHARKENERLNTALRATTEKLDATAAELEEARLQAAQREADLRAAAELEEAASQAASEAETEPAPEQHGESGQGEEQPEETGPLPERRSEIP